MGTSVEMIERRYGALLDGSGASMATRLGRLEADENRDAARPITEAECDVRSLLSHAICGRHVESPAART
jgi:hypothetical protein